MAEEFSTELVKRFTGEIASRLNKASALATRAQTIALWNAASIINRSEGGEERTG